MGPNKPSRIAHDDFSAGTEVDMGAHHKIWSSGQLDTLESLRHYIHEQSELNAARGLQIRRLLFDLSRRGLDCREVVRLEQSVMRLERAFAEDLGEDVREFRRRECIAVIDALMPAARLNKTIHLYRPRAVL